MNWPAQCAVVIPCLNEARHVAEVVRGARDFLPHVIVVDDGSADETARIARSAGAEVLINHGSGKGAALQAGFQLALRRGFTWALAMDGDGQHDARDIPRFFQTSARMVIGNRMEDTAAMPWLRRFVNRWMTARINRRCGLALPDSQCGFRLVHLDSWRALKFRAKQFEVESELIVRFAAARFAISSVPVRTVYGTERSKIRPVHDTLRWFAWWNRIGAELASSTEPFVVPGKFATR